jgi:hypothetical protein
MELLSAIASKHMQIFSSHLSAQEQCQDHFQRISPYEPPPLASRTPLQTGLGLLMTTVKNEAAAQQPLFQADLADREQQASALAAAGMVAESLSLSWPVRGALVQGNQKQPQEMRAPQAAGMVHPSGINGNGEMDVVNWNVLDLENAHLDDLEMDFAMLFDPANEAASVSKQAE